MDRDDYLLEQLYATAQLMNTPLEAPAALMILSDLAHIRPTRSHRRFPDAGPR